YASYNKAAIDYIYNRDNMRSYTVTDLNKDGKVDGEDFFIGIEYMQNGCKEDTIYREDHYIEEERRNHPCWHLVYSEYAHCLVWVYD
ncbi:MAG: hypothetical protein IK123_12440, partial [Lachnospiraceae bacterium]|nr:hypothetical protein [Lachnospiraceae bacterium]